MGTESGVFPDSGSEGLVLLWPGNRGMHGVHGATGDQARNMGKQWLPWRPGGLAAGVIRFRFARQEGWMAFAQPWRPSPA